MEAIKQTLEIQGLCKSYGQTQVLNDLDLTVGSGQIVGLLGPNGAGKSTLIRIVNRILSADQGKVLFNGQPINATHLDQIGYLPEERGLYRQMRVEEQGIYFAMLKGLSKAKASEQLNDWLKRLGIENWKNKKVQDLSKGMGQKFQFITTLLHDPDLIILDEPFSGFDPVNREVILEIILELKAQGKAILLSTHDMASVESLCDYIYLLDDAKFLVEGPPAEVKKTQGGLVYEIGFIGPDIAFANSLWTAFELIGIEKTDGHSIAQVKPTAGQPINTLLQSVIGQLEVKYVYEKWPDIGDIYVELVAKSNAQP